MIALAVLALALAVCEGGLALWLAGAWRLR